MSEDLFTCPECESPEPEAVGIDASGDVLILLECDWCEYKWYVRAPVDSFV